MKLGAAATALLLLLGAAAARASCPPAGPVQVSWRSEPARIAIGQPFRLLLDLCPTRARLLALDATMPEHRHGMNYRPTLVALGGGRWRADGLLWHMSGKWELRFDVELDDQPQTLRQAVTLP